jgi:hypothetical protein
MNVFIMLLLDKYKHIKKKQLSIENTIYSLVSFYSIIFSY